MTPLRSAAQGPARPRVCVIDSERLGPAYPRLERCRLDIRAVLPRFGELDAATLARFDVILVGCDERVLHTPRFGESVARMAGLRCVIGIAKQPTPRLALEAANTGFHGLVDQAISPRALERTVAAVLNGELAFSRSVLSVLARRSGHGQPRPTVLLTARQRQVVELIAQGATDAQIGRALGISASTAHKHVQSALRRMNARTRGQLVASVGLVAAMGLV